MTKEKLINGLTTNQVTSAPLPIVTGRRTSRHLLNGHGSAERIRQNIKAAMLVHRLQRIANGEVEAESHQVTAALGLLRKVLPDLQATLLSVDPQSKLTVILRDE